MKNNQEKDTDFSPDDQMAADYIMKVIQQALGDIYSLYPSQTSFTAGAALLTAGTLLMIELSGREKAAQALESLAEGIAGGRFDSYTKRYRLPLQ